MEIIIKKLENYRTWVELHIEEKCQDEAYNRVTDIINIIKIYTNKSNDTKNNISL